jgi:hypothetical protein
MSTAENAQATIASADNVLENRHNPYVPSRYWYLLCTRLLVSSLVRLSASGPTSRVTRFGRSLPHAAKRKQWQRAADTHCVHPQRQLSETLTSCRAPSPALTTADAVYVLSPRHPIPFLRRRCSLLLQKHSFSVRQTWLPSRPFVSRFTTCQPPRTRTPQDF